MLHASRFGPTSDLWSYWNTGTWILCYLTIKSDTGEHLQFLRCFSYYVLCSSGVAAVHLFVAEPCGTIRSFENLQTLFVQFVKPQIIIWLQPMHYGLSNGNDLADKKIWASNALLDILITSWSTCISKYKILRTTFIIHAKKSNQLCKKLNYNNRKFR